MRCSRDSGIAAEAVEEVGDRRRGRRMVSVKWKWGRLIGTHGAGPCVSNVLVLTHNLGCTEHRSDLGMRDDEWKHELVDGSKIVAALRSPDQKLRSQGITKCQFNEIANISFPISNTRQDAVGA